MNDDIGYAAGKVWDKLNNLGRVSPTRLANETGLSINTVQRALGWLAREGKITLNKTGRAESVQLTE